MNIGLNYKLFYVTLLFIGILYSQENKHDSIVKHQADFETIRKGNKVLLKPKLTPLRQIAGAPKAFWDNYWEFGDGEYSFENEPTHTYKEPGEYTIRLASTNNYDDGEPPATRPKKIMVNGNDSASINENPMELNELQGLRIQNNREPRPNENMQLIVSYANEKEIPLNGKLFLFYNDKKFKNKNFDLIDVRSYNNERETTFDENIAYHKIKSKNDWIQTTGINTFISENLIENDTLKNNLLEILEESKNKYYNYKVWDIDQVKPNKENNLFFTLKTTPEMLKDTSAILTIRSIYIPERENSKYKITEKEMEIVTSHDPNKMAVYNSRLNYRLVRFKRLKYKIRFQNNGEGPATTIKLETDIPKMFDKSSLKVLDMYPKVPICPDNQNVSYSCIDTVLLQNKIHFIFKNIYLPGSNQKNVHEKDSTKGFVKYSIKFGKDFHKVNSVSKTAIYFDKNPPILTNKSVVRFKPGLSIGAKAGYNYFFTSDESVNFEQNLDNSTINSSTDGYFIGATFSPFKSYKWYWQAEIMLAKQQIEGSQYAEYIVDNAAIPYLYKTTQQVNIDKTLLDIVPASVRYNINSNIGLGFGMQVSTNFSKTTDSTYENKVFYFINNQPEGEIRDLYVYKENSTSDNNIKLDNYGLFIDITAGFSRIGPSVGARYVQNFKEPKKQLHFYAIWKF